jgi:hypothetical protein
MIGRIRKKQRTWSIIWISATAALFLDGEGFATGKPYLNLIWSAAAMMEVRSRLTLLRLTSGMLIGSTANAAEHRDRRGIERSGVRMVGMWREKDCRGEKRGDNNNKRE